MAPKVSGLFVYPIKSCAGIEVREVRLVERGLEHDRRWMIVDEQGTFVTQRTLAALGQVHTALSAQGIRLDYPGADTFELPHGHPDGPRRVVKVWSHSGEAVVHEAGSAWLTRALGRPLGLVYMPDDHHRPVNPAWARPSDIVSFADGYPLLLISEASLADLNGRLATPLSMRRFRPNVVIDDTTPYAEDFYRRLTIGPVSFRAAKRCDRCVVTTLDPDTGVSGKEPLKTLATYRLQDGKVWFGINLIHDGPGLLRVGDLVGDLVEVSSAADHP